MRCIFLICSAMLIAAAGARFAHAVEPEGQASAPNVDFTTQVQPILQKHCLECHGKQPGAGGLRLTSREEALAGGDSGKKVLVPGKPDHSRLITLISGKDAELRMPPEGEGEPLTPQEVQTLTRWIAEGAIWPAASTAAMKQHGHWAFQKPVKPMLPHVRNTAWPRNEIDHFVLERIEREGVPPSAEAPALTLARRVSLDLIGLPPTAAELQELLQDRSAQAYEHYVDRLLASPAFGERWAMLWLDLARYADSRGYGADKFRTIWKYRDWVVNAFNENMPYDRFTIEQIAGDMLPRATEQQVLATAFNRNSMANNEGGVDDVEFHLVAVRDRVETTMQVWMGLTLGCARCHTHKYDPITQREYYQAVAFFNQTQDNNSEDEEPKMRNYAKPGQAEEQAGLALVIQGLKKQLEVVKDKASLEAKLAAARQRYVELEGQCVTTPVMHELPPEKRRVTRMMVKGSYLDQTDAVEPNVPAAFHPLPHDAKHDRLGFARWLVDRDNPLTARVAVNRFWSQLFGRGIVESEEDFGTQGSPPSHGELLDWLALDFARDWDMKRLLRSMVTSATYRQASIVRADLRNRDPDNRLLARGPRVRLSAELLRDQALAVSGLLSRKVGGPPVYPLQPEGIWVFLAGDKWPTSKGEDAHRRSLYTFWRRLAMHPTLMAFDAPSREVCVLRRRPTNTPLQALVTLNDPIYVEASQAFARRIATQGGASPDQRAAFALRTALARNPEPQQIASLCRLYDSELQHYREHRDDAVQVATNPLGPLSKGSDAADLAAWTVVASVVLNMDGVLTKN